jgi:hypothetical protein
MNNRTNKQRGEGKVGCIVTLVVLAIATAVGLKVIPLYYADNQVIDVVDRKADQAAGKTAEIIEKEIRSEIKNLDVPEALAPRAIVVIKSIGGEQGSITITVKYSRKVDLYGVAQWPFNIDKTITRAVYDNIR